MGQLDWVSTAIVVLVLAAVIGLWIVVGRARDRRRATKWEEFIRSSSSTGYDLVYVRKPYQYARTGTKAVITWIATGRQQDTWFRGWHVSEDTYVLVIGSTGWGLTQLQSECAVREP